MRRVVMFKDHDKSACARLNDWLDKNPDVTLIDIKPILSRTNSTTIYAIVELKENEKGVSEI